MHASLARPEVTPTNDTAALHVAPYERRQPLVEIRFTCAVCGTQRTVHRVPGFLPRYCPPAPGQKVSPCQREGNRRRVERWRKRQFTR